MQAEQVVLGALLQSHAASGLTAEAFIHPAHRDLYWRLVVGHPQFEDAADLVAALEAGPSAGAVACACSTIRQNWLARVAS